jgi:redox-sensitive bicupin YhaK (pirin superfamily)
VIVERRSHARGHVGGGWLDSRHTFSFGHYYDPEWMGFSALRVINEDRVAPGAGFPPHRHANMEILSYVLEGALAHRDDSGRDDSGRDDSGRDDSGRDDSGGGPGGGVLRAGELQWMGAGHGIEHSEFNASQREPVHFLQIWIQPDRLNAPPGHAQRAFDPAARRGRWATLASPDGVDGSLAIRQQAWLRGCVLGDGESLDLTLDPARRYWLHLARGALAVAGRELEAGDALGFVDEAGSVRLDGRGGVPADVLVFDLPH